jgi:proteic killer suppression protein
VTRSTIHSAIKSFRHAPASKEFFTTGSKAGIQPSHAAKLSVQLFQLNRSKTTRRYGCSGMGIAPLPHGDLQHHWSVKVNGNWRLTFAFEGENVTLVDYQDYH